MDLTRAAAPALPATSIFASAHRFAFVIELIVLALVLGLAISFRLPNLDAYTGKFDEGIRTAQLMLMSHGFRPVRDIFASQGPLSLDIFFPFWEAAGQSLGGARFAVVVYSIGAIVLSGMIARSVGGPVAGIVTALLLALSPTFLKNSRLALVEIPALVPALAALLAILHGRRERSRFAIGVGAALLAIALMVKPMAAPVLAPCAALLILRAEPPRRIISDLILAGLVGLITLTGIAIMFGPDLLFDQVVRYRQGSVAVEKWSFGENWRMIADELMNEQLGFFVISVLGALTLLRWQTAFAVSTLVWIGASFWLLITYVPLQIKHDTILLPPLSIVAGAGIGILIERARRASTRHSSLVLASVAAIGLLAYVAGTPAILARNRQTINVAGEGRADLYPDETQLIQALTQPTDFIITDDPFLSYGADRLVPPLLVDTSFYRIRSGSLSPQDVIESATRFDVQLLFLFTDGLRELRRFSEWVDEHYQVISTQERSNGKDRSIYLRRDADLTHARNQLEQQLDEKSSIEFANQVALIGYALDRREIRAGGNLELTLAWESIGPTPVDYRIVTILRGPDGQPVEQSERSLSGGGVGTSRWETGRWIFRTTTLDIRRARQSGDYTLAVGLYDSRARKLAPVTSGGSGEDAPLATVRLRT
ncbi:MAG: ArnT family glycosyltransferase [Chloroflexota bacterium]